MKEKSKKKIVALVALALFLFAGLAMVTGCSGCASCSRSCVDFQSDINGGLDRVINIYTANTSYLAMHLRYENAYSFYSSLTAQIRQMPEFQEGTRLAVVGNWQSPEFYTDQMEFTEYLVGVKGFLPSDYSANSFMEYYIGFPAEFVSTEEAEALRQTEAYQNMNIYPYYGSIAVIDDVIVVKLSE